MRGMVLALPAGDEWPLFVGAALVAALVFFWLALLLGRWGSAVSVPAPAPRLAGEKQRAYGWDEFIHDMGNGDLTLDEILERCRDAGGIPKRPHGAPPPPDNGRFRARMAWFEAQAQEVPLLKVVPPPPPPRPVLAVKAWLVPCSRCAERRRGHIDHGGLPDCPTCGGTGHVPVTGG